MIIVLCVLYLKLQFVYSDCCSCTFTSAPEGIIDDVTVAIDSSTSITITWLPANPSLWNGIVLSYTIEYQRQESPGLNNLPEPYITSTSSIPSLPQHPLANNPDPRLVTLPLVEETLHLEGLEENYVYRFIVYFENSAGRSEVSSPVQVRMPPSGTHHCQLYIGDTIPLYLIYIPFILHFLQYHCLHSI